MKHMRIAFLAPAPGARGLSPFWKSVLKRLPDSGVKAEIIVPEKKIWELPAVPVLHDLYVLTSPSPLATSLAGVLTIDGAGVLNSFAGVSLCMDRIASTAVLASAGVPVPPSYAAGRPSLLSPMLDEGPLFTDRFGELKEATGNGEYVMDRYGLPVPLFASRRPIAESGIGNTAYVVKDAAWITLGRYGRIPPDAGLEKKIRDAALACGKALSLEIYSVEFAFENGRFEVTRVNPFPGYGGPDEAAAITTEYIIGRAMRPGKK